MTLKRFFGQKKRVDFEEIFSPMVRISSIHVLLDLAASLDLEIEQMDVKTIFLYGDLNEEIYMKQAKVFVMKGKEDYLWNLVIDILIIVICFCQKLQSNNKLLFIWEY